jgi:hypothetical protein
MNHTDKPVRHTWVPWVAALAGAAFTLKVLLILGSGNGVPEEPMAVLYLTGLALGVAAGVGAGLRQQGVLRGLAVGAGSVVLLVLWIMGLGDALKPVVAVVSDAQHVKDEVPVLLAGLVLLGLAWRGRAHDVRGGAGTVAAATA